jgi:hypothetical protein
VSVLIESAGATPTDVEISVLWLMATDGHSSQHAKYPIRRPSGGAAGMSCERWVRLRFEPFTGRLDQFRVWASNYAPGAGWSLNFGNALEYGRPSTSTSGFALFPVPTAHPLESNFAGSIIGTGGAQPYYSPWLVLQASWSAPGIPGPIQSEPIELFFSWADH